MKKLLFCFLILLSKSLLYARENHPSKEFARLQTTNERIEYIKAKTIPVLDKDKFMQLLPEVQNSKDVRAIFYWYYMADFFKNQLSLKQSVHQEYLKQMKEICYSNNLKTEQVVYEFRKNFLEYAGKIMSEQDIYFNYLNTYDQVKSIGIENFRNYSGDWMMNDIGRNFYEMGDLDKALDCLLMAEKISDPNSLFFTLTDNLIESIYAEKKNYRNAILYAYRILKNNEEISNSSKEKLWVNKYWQCLSALNISNYAHHLNNIPLCKAYLTKGENLITRTIDFSENPKVVAEYDALQLLIRIKLALHQVKESEPLLARIDTLKNHLGAGMARFYFEPLSLYKNYVTFYEAKKNYTLAYKYLKLANELEDSLNRRNDKRKLWQAEMQMKSELYQTQIKMMKEESQMQKKIRNAAILIMLTLLTTGYIIYRKIKRDNSIINEQKSSLEQSLGEKETLLKEVHHRVKNNLQIISGLLEKQAQKSLDPNTRQLMKEGQDRVFSMALVHQNLYQSENLNAIGMRNYINQLTRNICHTQSANEKDIRVETRATDTVVSIDNAISIGLILNELITNCFKYAFRNRQSGNINITFQVSDNLILLVVEDDGEGLPSTFDLNSKKTLGMNLLKGLVRQLSGTLTYDSGSHGTRFSIICPQ